MKKVFLVTVLTLTASQASASCFNASEVSAEFPSPFASAPAIKKQLGSAVNDIGWEADDEDLDSASYQIIGKIGTVSGDSVEVCAVENSEGGLAYQAFAKSAGSDNAGFMPLKGEKK